MASIIGVETLQHTNGTTAATIDSSGRFVPKVRCMANVGLSTANAQDTTNPYGTNDTDIRFDKIHYNVGSAYTESNGRFTAPVDGYYEVSFFALADNGTTGHASLDIYKNGTRLNSGRAFTHTTSGQHQMINATAIIELDANDYVTIRAGGTAGIYINADGQYNGVTFKLLGD